MVIIVITATSRPPADRAHALKIARIDALILDEFPNLLRVRLTAGVGEIFCSARAAEALVHETAAEVLLGRDPRHINGLFQALQPYVGDSGPGAETRLPVTDSAPG